MNWLLIPEGERPQVTLLNLFPLREAIPPSMRFVQGDACTMRPDRSSYDVVFSNSVIEHVGDWTAQEQFANAIRRLDLPYWVQTPNRRFPVEPHFQGIGVQFLPPRIAHHYIRFATVWGWVAQPSSDRIRRTFAEIRLLTRQELTALFPGAKIHAERVGPLTKSLVAINV